LIDGADDAPANPSHTLSYSLNITSCLAAKGVAFNSGDTVQLEIVARSQTAGDNSAQQVFFKRG